MNCLLCLIALLNKTFYNPEQQQRYRLILLPLLLLLLLHIDISSSSSRSPLTSLIPDIPFYNTPHSSTSRNYYLQQPNTQQWLLKNSILINMKCKKIYWSPLYSTSALLITKELNCIMIFVNSLLTCCKPDSSEDWESHL